MDEPMVMRYRFVSFSSQRMFEPVSLHLSPLKQFQVVQGRALRFYFLWLINILQMPGFKFVLDQRGILSEEASSHI